jgi:aminopeptidase N
MEHQSAIAYGNRFANGYLGRDLSASGWGLKWDFIIVHESGHEWFGNSITTSDIADMWVHEGFTAYSEALYVECQFGKQAAEEYVTGTRRAVANDRPVIGDYGVNAEGSGDMYYKASNMIHMIRSFMGNDSLFRQMLRGLNRDFYHGIVTTEEVETYVNEFSGKDFSQIFDQYLRTSRVPVLEYAIDAGSLYHRWTECIDGFEMTLPLEEGIVLNPSEEWKRITWSKDGEVPLKADRNYFVFTRRVSKLPKVPE